MTPLGEFRVGFMFYFVIVLSTISFIEARSSTFIREDPGSCNNSKAGKSSLVTGADGNERVLVCLKNNGKYIWRTLDSFPTLGEFYNPAEDCSHIATKRNNAQSGLFWIKGVGLKKPTKVWCDLSTDGGGFMLVGYKSSPVSWTVPSNSSLVSPKGEPHWSSAFGYVQMLEFRIQISTTNCFADTKADWLYRFTAPRRLGKLLISGKKSGCTKYRPGIGEIKYVKDLLAGRIVTRMFQCSRFGSASAPGLGWEMMNTCLKKPCKNGFAYFPGTNYRYDSYGAFSYSTANSRSGILHNSTVFIGCEHSKCCACFGPKGVSGDFCSPGCRSINGGTITKKAHTWFWVRSSVPKKAVWKKCAEFQVRNNGKLETHFVDETTGILNKGSCSKKGTPNIVPAVVEVDDKKQQDRLPLVKGQLSYRKDNEKLYFTNGQSWEALGKEKQEKNLDNRLTLQVTRLQSGLKKSNSKLEKKVQDLEKKLTKEFEKYNMTLEKKIQALQKKIPGKNCYDIYKQGSRITGIYQIDPDGQGKFKVLCDMTTAGGGWTVFQRRLDGSVNFYRGWNDYKNGFGNLNGEFWLGLDKIYRLTKHVKNVLRVDLEDWLGNTAYATYSYFAIGNQQSKYKLSLGSYSGTAGDPLKMGKGMAFSTKDSDNDGSSGNCAVWWRGAWWYASCHNSNLNGIYYRGHNKKAGDGVTWHNWKGHHYSMKKTAMKIRPT